MNILKRYFIVISLVFSFNINAVEKTEINLEDLALLVVYTNLYPHIEPCVKDVDKRKIAALVKNEHCMILIAEADLEIYIIKKHKVLRKKVVKHWSPEMLTTFDNTFKDLNLFRKKVKELMDHHKHYQPNPEQQAT